jgi:hypothetical protein
MEALNLLQPGPFHWSDGLERTANARRGRAYGASALFRFWTGPESAGPVRSLWEDCASRGPNSFRALGGVLGDPGELGPAFRALFDRFRVGSVLLEAAPTDCRIADATHLRAGTPKKRPLRPPIGDLDPEFATHWAALATDPAARPVVREMGLAGLATGYLKFMAPRAVPAGSSVSVEVTPADPAISLRVAVRRDGAWTVVPDTTKAAGASLKIADLDRLDRAVALIVTRYERSDAEKSYRVTVRGTRGAGPSGATASTAGTARIYVLQVTVSRGGRSKRWQEYAFTGTRRTVEAVVAERSEALGGMWEGVSVTVASGPHVRAPALQPMREE